MSRNVTAILPAGRDWEVWGCSGVSRCLLKSTSASLEKIDGIGRGATVLGIPSQHCRTIALLLPKSEKGLLRKIVHAQLERRGLCRGGPVAGQFECHVIEERDDKTLVSIDVLPGPLPENLNLERATCYIAAGRAYTLPTNRAVIIAEQGQLILCIGRNDKLLHSQIISPSLELDAGLACEIKLTLLSLEGSGLVDEIEGIEAWGEFPPGQIAILREHLDVDVEAMIRPPPTSATHLRSMRHLLPPAALEARRATVRRFLVALACFAIAAGYGLFVYSKYQHLLQQEQRAAQLQGLTPDSPDTNAQERNKAIGARWAALRNTLEPKRYPMLHLSRITRAIPPGGVVISSFGSKVSEVNFAGTARSAKTAYAFFNAIQADDVLAVYMWEMPPPGVKDDGRARFSIKGKMT